MGGFTTGGTDFTELQDSIRDWLVREDNEVTDRIPSFIRLAEIRAAREIRTVRLMVVKEYTATQDDEDNGYLPLPADFNGMVNVSVARNGQQYRLEFLSPAQYLNSGGNAGSGQPWACTIIGERFYTQPPQGAEATATFTYYALPPRLGALYQENILSRFYGDVLLYGSLAEAMPYLKDDKRLPNFGQLYDAALMNIRREDDALREDDSAQLVTSPYSATLRTGSYGW